MMHPTTEREEKTKEYKNENSSTIITIIITALIILIPKLIIACYI